MIFICVGTPSDDRGHTDLRYVLSAADDIADVLKSLGPKQEPKVIVMKSTVPVGTTLMVRDRIRARAGDGIPFRVADNPEFLKEGAAIEDFMKPDRVVVGVEDEATGNLFRDLYDPFVRNGHPIYIMDVVSAEMVKYASNNFLATKISFINEMANLCEAYGADIGKVREGMCSDKRIGNAFLYPGLGYGGSCFPKDTLACIMMGETKGVPVAVSKAVHETNQRQRDRFFLKIQDHFKSFGGLTGRTLAFWGIAFKPRTDDIREAPALTLIRKALGYGALIRAFDPVANENARRELGPGPVILEDMYEAAKGADALVVCTDWDEFKSPDFAQLAKRGAQRQRQTGQVHARKSPSILASAASWSVPRPLRRWAFPCRTARGCGAASTWTTAGRSRPRSWATRTVSALSRPPPRSASPCCNRARSTCWCGPPPGRWRGRLRLASPSRA
ncbi:UDP-glucose/GDP-mannose dehydrogenase family protein [Leptolyngbya sp. 15MV]|nr:UDP-glucose/GDP-mannose dehydrogenase family protein [Leptolyngbya sp. 15MV]